MKKLLKRIFKVHYFIMGAVLLGCSSDDSPEGGNLPKVEAGFTFALNSDTGTATFTNTSSNATTYSWDFGDGNTSTQTNPSNTFDAGTYTVKLTASNTAGASDIFEDEVMVVLPEEGAMVAIPITFDNADVDYSVTTFEGTTFDVVDNPALGGANEVSSKVGAIVNIGAVFEGFYFDLGADVDLTTNKTIKIDFWADAEVNVLIKLEEGDGEALEVTQAHGGTGWEELLFNFNSANSFSRLTIFVDGSGTTAGTFYIDNIEQIETVGGGDPNCMEEVAQSLSATDFNLTFQIDPTESIVSDNAGFTWVNNPDTDNDVNNSCKVGQIDRTDASAFANNQITLDGKLDFSANAGFKIKVWSPNAETSVMLKLEDANDAGTFTEVFATTTQASAWEELTFPVAVGDNGRFDKIVLFFELNTNTAETYFIDDLALYARDVIVSEGPNLIINGDFETGDVSGWNGDTAGNSGSFGVSDINSKCGVYSANLAVNEAQLQIVTQTSIGVGVVTPNSEITLSFDLRGTAGTGGEFIPLLFSNSSIEAVGVSKTDNLDGPIQPNESWTRYTYTTTAGSDVSGGLTLLLQGVCGAVADCSANVFIDNVYLGLGAGSGPTDCVPTNGTASVGVTGVTVNEAAGTATFAVQLSGADVSGGFTVDYATADGTAVQPDDYTSTAGTLTFAGTNGETQNIVVPIIDDTAEEVTETFVVNLSNTAVEIGNAQATGTISSNDGAITELTTNGDFETGDLTGWTLFVDAPGASFEASNAQASDGTFSGFLASDFNAGVGGAVDAVVKQANVGVGTVTPNTDYIVSFDLRGFSGEGGDLFVEFFSELSGGGTSAAEILGNGPLTPTDTWTPYSFTVTTGNDVSGGITLQLKTSCGPVPDCVVEGYFDNVSMELAE